MERVRVLYDYEAQEPNELTLKEVCKSLNFNSEKVLCSWNGGRGQQLLCQKKTSLGGGKAETLKGNQDGFRLIIVRP